MTPDGKERRRVMRDGHRASKTGRDDVAVEGKQDAQVGSSKVESEERSIDNQKKGGDVSSTQEEEGKEWIGAA